jgi:hypothetical protein
MRERSLLRRPFLAAAALRAAALVGLASGLAATAFALVRELGSASPSQQE